MLWIHYIISNKVIISYLYSDNNQLFLPNTETLIMSVQCANFNMNISILFPRSCSLGFDVVTSKSHVKSFHTRVLEEDSAPGEIIFFTNKCQISCNINVSTWSLLSIYLKPSESTNPPGHFVLILILSVWCFSSVAVVRHISRTVVSHSTGRRIHATGSSI